MPKMHHRPLPSGGGQKVFLATPCMDAPKPSYTYSLGQTMAKSYIPIEYALYSGDCHVDDARNVLVAKFLEGDCTDLVFIDADIGWEADELMRLCEYNRDVVASTYPYKQEDEGYPVAFLGGEIRADAAGLIPVAAVPTGFLRIKRHVLQTLADKAEKFKPKAASKREIPLIFERQTEGGSRRGGDYAFCHKWRALGGKIHLDPEISLTHTGDNTWTGSWGHFKRTEMYGAVNAGLLEIQEGIETTRTSIDMVKAWGNNWSGDAPLVEAAILLARNSTGPILEFGSGLTTLVMAAANPNITITAIEHNDEWIDAIRQGAAKNNLDNIVIHKSGIAGGFYSDVPQADYALILCDGPPRTLGKRNKVFEQPINGAVLLMDDCDCPVLTKELMEWSESQGRQTTVLGRVGISRKAA